MSNKKKSFNMNLREVENFFRYRRMNLPKRSAELIAIIAISCTLFLFLHTKNLHSKLHELEVKLQPSELSALGLTGTNRGDEKDPKSLHGTYEYLKSTGQTGLSAADLNNTKKSGMNVIFFNRVPKVGSQTLMELIKRLGRINGFDAGRDKQGVVEIISGGLEYQKEIAEEVFDIIEPAVFTKHVAHINFTTFNIPKPIYINLVRDPIERVISWYYYVRAPWYFVSRMLKFPELKLPDIKWLELELGDCLRAGYKECTFEQGGTNENIGDHRRQMLFFCGHNDAHCQLA